ncbi:hypothetical protein ABEF92_004320 [Exophiala dermatitidis]|uniref:F-box domain-containing protein n=1 Tax=Exophiala dermatitidis (strain ATCC 34100 / CBS 525.76 / NIH/UT8656) TaxID=858893 RepID=H6BKK9_EXODN|nr:uncharacterized protein HMPREF1120_00852 [Exophiala dermatitidis NIH/UT8656]EHY52643.1 hypothetical protein HMPREF1120_00852 [Exophiala dermatitidis NIH/UT8656]
MPLLDLPPDILSDIFSFLRPRDYLAFCQTSRSIYSEWRQDPLYWRTETYNSFRLPISPLLAADGPRWYWLYKRLKTQTQLYAWGSGIFGVAGSPGSVSLPRRLVQPSPARVLPRVPARPNLLPRIPQRPLHPRVRSGWPVEIDVPPEVGPIADLQCGGWSTTILASDGKLYSTGQISQHTRMTERLTQLEYITQSTSAIRQFSSGRAHILALTDHGGIISWTQIYRQGVTILSRNNGSFGGKPVRVAAGWVESSAYVPETGIIYWRPPPNRNDDMLDAIIVQEKVIPGTACYVADTGVVEVTKHVVLEDYIVWITTDSKLYACCLSAEDDAYQPEKAPFEVPGFGAADRELKDIQGQFRRFGVFTATGEVLAGDVDYLRRCAETLERQPDLFQSGDWSALTTLLVSRPQDIPALQHTNVIALTFGDYHYHALHADGKITSYGVDSQCCGQLGLALPGTGGRFRGLRQERPGLRGDAVLLPIANLRGRRVWFEPEKQDWLQWMENELHQSHLSLDGRPASHTWDDDPVKQAAFSEWVEQEGNHWNEGPATSPPTTVPKTDGAREADDYANLGAYFPIAIAAAGWHSGALVLVDEEKAHEIRSKWVFHRQKGDETTHSMPGAFESLSLEEVYAWEKDGFPKVRLPNGYEMPGEGEPRIWRDGVPTMRELGLEE